MKNLKNGKTKEVKVEMINTTIGRNVSKKPLKNKLNLNTITNILHNVSNNVITQIVKKVVASGIIFGLALITIIDITVGYTWSWMTFIHVMGSGCIYHVLDDFIEKISRTILLLKK